MSHVLEEAYAICREGAPIPVTALHLKALYALLHPTVKLCACGHSDFESNLSFLDGRYLCGICAKEKVE